MLNSKKTFETRKKSIASPENFTDMITEDPIPEKINSVIYFKQLSQYKNNLNSNYNVKNETPELTHKMWHYIIDKMVNQSKK